MTTVTQNIVDDVTNAYKANATIKPTQIGALDWAPISMESWIAFQDQPMPEPIGLTRDLASTSKMLLDFIIARSASKNSTVHLPVTPELIAELYGRAPELYQEKYGSLFTPDPENAKQEILDYFAGKRPMLMVGELRSQMLQISSNEATTILRDWGKSVLGGIEGLQSKASELCPSVVLTISTEEGYHWIQGNSNTGDVSDLARLLHTVALKALPGSWEAEWLESLSHRHKPVSFDFCLTRSDLGKSLIATGHEIREKTGFNDLCFWQKSLAEQHGLPFHQNMCTVAQVVKPSGQIVTIALTAQVEVSQPEGWAEVVGMPQGVEFPDALAPEYDEYLGKVKAQLAYQFRQKLIEIWNSVQ